MARILPSLGRRVNVPARALGEVALVGVLCAALTLAWSDGTPNPGIVDVLVPTAMYVDSAGGYATGAHLRKPTTIPAPPPVNLVPTAAPVAILIPSINVHRPVEPVGVDQFGYMYTPSNLWNAGWYEGGPVPGAPGDAVLEGHAGYPKAPLLFGKLRLLHPGDMIVIVLADGTRQAFLVTSLKIYAAGTAPAGMGQPYGDPRLTLITCTGPFDDHYKTYADRLVVEARYAGIALNV